MKVIIIKKIENLTPGQIKDVADGYAKNFLIKNGYARPATPENVQTLEAETAQNKKAEEKKIKELEAKANAITGKSVNISVRVGEDSRLFGSVTTKDIQEALAKKGLVVDKHDIQVENIKNLGTYPATVKFGNNISAQITVTVVGE